MTIDLLYQPKTPVPNNPKCPTCLHYNQDAARTGVCEVGSAPTICGDGTAPLYGFAPLAEIAVPYEDTLEEPVGSQAEAAADLAGRARDLRDAGINVFSRVVLGDEDMQNAALIHKAMLRASVQGIHDYRDGEGRQRERPRTRHVAKALRSYFVPRKKLKFSEDAVTVFLMQKGFTVDEPELLAKAAKKGEGSRGGHITGHTATGHPIYGTSTMTAGVSDVNKPDAEAWHKKFQSALKGAHKHIGQVEAGERLPIEESVKHMDRIDKLAYQGGAFSKELGDTAAGMASAVRRRHASARDAGAAARSNAATSAVFDARRAERAAKPAAGSYEHELAAQGTGTARKALPSDVVKAVR